MRPQPASPPASLPRPPAASSIVTISVSNSSDALRISGCRCNSCCRCRRLTGGLAAGCPRRQPRLRLVRQHCEVDPNVPAGNPGKRLLQLLPLLGPLAILLRLSIGFSEPHDQSIWPGNCYTLRLRRRSPPSYLQSRQGFASKRQRRARSSSGARIGCWRDWQSARLSYFGAFFFERRRLAGSGVLLPADRRQRRSAGR